MYAPRRRAISSMRSRSKQRELMAFLPDDEILETLCRRLFQHVTSRFDPDCFLFSVFCFLSPTSYLLPPISYLLFPAARIRIAAFRPGAPMIPPPGCVAEPHI
jgi:hypothetical protein